MFEDSFLIEGWSGAIALWALCYGGLLLCYFGSGLVVEYLSAKSPERRIQSRKASDRGKDIRLSVLSLSSVAFYLAAGIFLQANGWSLIAPWELSWWSIPLSLVISVIVYDAWFYWFHRLMHTKLFYRFHLQHHVSIAPRAWSCNNDTLIGTFFEQSYFLLAPLILPIPPVVLIAQKIWDQVTCAFGHGGYEFFAGPISRSPWLGVSTVYHDQHHSHFKYNFGNAFTFWDRIAGTLHPRYDETVRSFEDLNRPRAPGE